MFIHTDPSPAHERNCHLTLGKSNEMDSDLTPKKLLLLTQSLSFPPYLAGGTILLFLHHTLELLILEEPFACSKCAASDWAKWALCQQDQNLQHYHLLVSSNNLISKS